MATRETNSSVYLTLRQLKRRIEKLRKVMGFMNEYHQTGESLLGLRRATHETGEMHRLTQAALAAVESNIKPDDQLAQYVWQMDLLFEDIDADEFNEV